ncbi:Spy/CpxP family protein refolding chaperone [Xenophilus arseniciresistens]|uniref:Spy/CpxP family protein refolding chaperone n=1 Tax=Xenophilus arseniciresistens TaxID=1283306 RepID=A0AAE3NDG9_9BURK|nr:Spy/CpxP family protein refolding chaperone [Xenophilus arseniciresistens]MDA7418826.1 Spy/CpxP family protein refolding chaperone [Xenophilus arseniciresistens]
MNKPWIRRSLAGALGAIAVAGSLVGCAGSRDRMPEGADAGAWQARMVERVGHKLDLNAMQKQKLQALAQALQAQRQALRAGQDPRAEFRALFADYKLDQAAAERLLAQKLEAMRSGGPAVIAATADFFDHLDAAQQQKVRAFMERGRRWGRHA